MRCGTWDPAVEHKPIELMGLYFMEWNIKSMRLEHSSLLANLELSMMKIDLTNLLPTAPVWFNKNPEKSISHCYQEFWHGNKSR